MSNVTASFVPVTHGVLVRSGAVGPWRYTETVHPPALRLPCHAHAHAAVTLVVSGAVDEVHGSHAQELRALSVLLKPAGSDHQNAYGLVPTRSFIIEIGEDEIAGLEPFARLERVAAFHGPSPAAARALAAYRAFRAGTTDLALLSERLLLELTGSYQPRHPGAGRPPRKLMKRIGEQLESQLKAPPRLTALAQETGLHPVYLARAFRATHGCSTSTFIRRARIRQALAAINAPGHEPLSQLALRLGFTDQAHFSRMFQQETGWPPARFRRYLHEVLEREE